MLDPQLLVPSPDSPRAAVRRPAGPPPRPPVTTSVPRPAARPVSAPPRAARLAGRLWAAACVAGGVALAVAAVDREALRSGLTEAARHADPGASAAVVDRGVALTASAAAGATVVLLMATAWSVVSFLRGRPRARAALLVAGILWVPLIGVDQGLVQGGIAVDRLAFLVQAALVVVASAALLSRPVRSWSGRAGR